MKGDVFLSMKKIFCILTSLFFVFPGLFVFAQEEYPNPEDISDMEYREIISSNEMNSSAELHDWVQNGKASISNGILTYTPDSDGNGAYLYLSKPVDAAQTKMIVLRMKIPVSVSRVEVYFADKASWSFSESKKVELKNITPSDEFQEICIDTASVPNWTGVQDIIRIGIDGVVGQESYIDYVRFYGGYYPAYTENERGRIYEFNGKDSGLETGEGISDALNYQGKLWARINGAGASLTTTWENTDLNAAEIPRIRISCNNQTDGVEGKLCFITDSVSDYGEEASYSFALESGEREYIIDTEENSLWKEKIKGLRLLPSDGTGIVQIDYISMDKFPCTVGVALGVVRISGNLYGMADETISFFVQNAETGGQSYSAEMTTDAQGNFSAEFEIPNAPEKPTVFNLIFSGEKMTGSVKKKVVYITADYKQRILDEINRLRREGSAAQLQELLEENYGLLYLKAEEYEQFVAEGDHLSELYGVMMGGQAADQSELEYQLNEAAVLLKVRYGTMEEFLGAIERYNEYLQFQSLPAYTTYASVAETTQREAISRLLTAHYNNMEEMRDAFEESVILTAIHRALTSGEVRNILETNAELLDIDLSSAEGLKNPSAVYQALTERGFSSLAEVKQAYKDAVDAQAEKEKSSGSGNGSNNIGGKKNGGGGSGAGGYVALPPQTGPAETTPGQEQSTTIRPTFSDMSGFDWAQTAVETLCAKGIVNGTGDGRFEPSREVRREEFVKMLAVAFELPLTADAEFADIAADDWCAPYVGAAVRAGFVRGMGEIFGVGQTLSRQDAAVMAARALRMEESDGIMKFTDSAEIADYARSAVNALAQAGILQGTEDGFFRPNGVLTRAEAAVILNRIMEGLGE